YLDRAAAVADRDADPARALLWLARALETAPDGGSDLRRVTRTSLEACRAQVLPLRGLFTYPAVVSAAAFSPDGRRILTGAEDGRARLWDAATGAELASLPHGRDRQRPAGPAVGRRRGAPAWRAAGAPGHDLGRGLQPRRPDRPDRQRRWHRPAVARG